MKFIIIKIEFERAFNKQVNNLSNNLSLNEIVCVIYASTSFQKRAARSIDP